MNVAEQIQIQVDLNDACLMLEKVGLKFTDTATERDLQLLVAEYSRKVSSIFTVVIYSL